MIAADFTDSTEVATRLKLATQRLHELAPHVGVAKQVREFDGDRRKNLLAKYAVKHLKNGESASASDAYARADASYVEELNKLAEQYRDAEHTLARWTAEQCSYEAARSLLSFSKQILGSMPE